MTLVWWVVEVVVGFAAGWGLGTWRGTCKGNADFTFRLVENKAALRNFLKGEIARKGGLEAVAKGIKKDTAFGTVIDELLNRMEILRVASMAAEYIFYAFLVAFAVGGAYPIILGVPICLMTVRQAAKERGEPLGLQSIFQLFGMLHVWLRDNPVDVLNYVKVQKVPVRNIIDVLRESGGYAV